MKRSELQTASFWGTVLRYSRTPFLGHWVNRAKIAGTYPSGLRTHTAVIIQHWVQ
jgi:hypothetical protein